MVKQHANNTLSLKGVRRSAVGTTSAQGLRAQGLMPGVVYGKKTETMAIAVDRSDLIHILHTEAGEHSLLTLCIEEKAAGTRGGAGTGGKSSKGAGKGTGKGASKRWEQSVIVKEVQHHPVAGHVLHVDFHAIVLTERIRVKIAVELRGEPVGVKEQGGILEHFLREVEVECLPMAIPKHFEFDVNQLTIGDAVHVRDLTPVPQVTIMSDPDGVIASVLAPKEEKVEEEAVVTEPEVIGEKKEGAEEGEGETPKAGPDSAGPGGKKDEGKGKKDEGKKKE